MRGGGHGGAHRCRHLAWWRRGGGRFRVDVGPVVGLVGDASVVSARERRINLPRVVAIARAAVPPTSRPNLDAAAAAAADAAATTAAAAATCFATTDSRSWCLAGGHLDRRWFLGLR